MGVAELEKSINAKFKSDVMYSPYSELGVASMPRFSTGSLMLDIDSGGGWPRGKIIEILGPESSGKTAILSHAMASITNQEGEDHEALLVDEEGSFSPDWTCEKNGVNIKNLRIVRSQTAEQALDVIEVSAESGAFEIIGLDSVAALVPKDEADGSVEDSHYALTARLMGKVCRKAYRALRLAAKAGKKLPTLIFINQIRIKMNVKYGSPETTPGGNALKFASSIRLDIRKDSMLGDKEKDLYYGQRSRYSFIKNKTAPPLRKGEIDIFTDGPYAGQIDNHRALAVLGEESGFIVKKGTWYSGEWLDKGVQGLDNVAEYFRTYAPSELNKFVLQLEKVYLGNKPLSFRFSKIRTVSNGRKNRPTVPENMDPETGELIGEIVEKKTKGKKGKK